MKIQVFPYKQLEQIIAKQPIENIISIRDIGYNELYNTLDDNAKNMLVLKFDDVTAFSIKNKMIHEFYDYKSKKRDLVLFNEDMAKEIIKFANTVYNTNSSLTIHCWAGKSRSQAIAYVLNNYYNLLKENNLEDYKNNLSQFLNDFHGNQDVIRILTNCLITN
jgi:predicted protein tyrosine phosphatase